ncbi:MAG: T9SS type A sorting domain-containing protein [Candidatus Marinimicrobia bacterium]|nr:T9SS type A sorting domain-containing protein [Candidatus Neomarinimicrobiota bacterium]
MKHFVIMIFSLVSIGSLFSQTVERYYDTGQRISKVEIQAFKNRSISKLNESSNKTMTAVDRSKTAINQNKFSETLETTFNNNNGYSGNYFQIDVLKSGGITVSSMAGNFGTTGGAGVWVRDGAIGNAPGTGWSQVASATISGTNKQTFSTNFTLAQGTYTMFFANTGGGSGVASLNYTNGTGVGNVAAQNSDLKIYEGYGTSDIAPNTGSWSGNGYGFSPRIWNGSLTYTAATPTIASSSLSSDNNYLDVTISEAVYNTNAGSGALESSDFSLTFAQNSGNATAATISSIKKNDNTAEGSATALSGGETMIRVFLSISSLPSGVETITITPVNGSSIYNTTGQAMGSSESTGAKTLKDKAPSTITGVSIASDNSTIAVTMSEAVYNTNGGNGALEASDFTFTISGGAASLSSATPTSISSSGNVYTLGIGISGTPTGAETLTVNPVDNGIYDALGNESITNQSNNSANLMDKAPPTISGVSLASDNSAIYLTMSEAVFNTNTGSGSLESSDFSFSISGGTATLSSSQPSEMASSGNVYTLGISLNGTADGNEVLTVSILDNAIYDAGGNEANTSQSNNVVRLNDKTPSIILSVSITSNNNTIAVTMSEAVYNTNSGSGSLESSDFSYSISGGTATLSSSTPTSISKNSNVYTLGLSISGTPDGAETLVVNPVDDGIFDVVGNESTTNQSNNSAKLNDKVAPGISTASIDASNNYIDITLSEGIYSDINSSSPLVNNDLSLTFRQNNGNASSVSINSLKKNDNTAQGSASALSGGESVIRVFLNIVGTPSGVETVSISPVDGSSVYDKVGNVMLSSQSTGVKNLKDQLLPLINSTFLAADNSTIAVTMSEPVFNTNSGSGALEVSDFIFSISGGTATLSSTTPSSISIDDDVYTLGISLSGTVNGKEELVVAPVSNSIYDASGNGASTSQSNNIADLYDVIVPVVLSISLASDNSTVALTFSEAVYNATGGSGALEVSDFSFSMTGGVASLSSTTPTSISSSGNVYTLGINISGNPNGYELLVVNPKDDSIYDFDNNEASTSQKNNSINLNDNTFPTVTSVSSITANGTYGIGNVVQITTIFNEEVFVTGIPQISLETGSTDMLVNYSSGSGSNTLVFNYTVAAGDTTSDLDYKASTSLALNGGTVKDAVGNAATLTLASPAATFSLGANKDLVIDGITPTVVKVNSNKSNGSYGVNDTIPINIFFNQTITVTGNPQLILETGITDGIASYASGTGSKQLVFNYIISQGENSDDLDYTSTSALILNSGTIKDSSANAATLTLVSPSNTNSLSANKDLVVDTNGPTILSVSSTTADGAYNANDTIVVAVTFSDNVFVSGTPILLLETGEIDAVIDFTNGSGTKVLSFNYIINSNHNTKKLKYKTSSSLLLYGGSINDNVGNPSTLTLPIPGKAESLSGSNNLIIDNINPLVSYVSESENENIDFTNVIDSFTIYWTTQLDTISGIEHYEISIGTSPGDSNKVSWLKIDSLSYSYSSSLTFKDLGLENNIKYYASVRATDKAGNVSPVMTGDGITIDLSSPTAGTVNDGLGPDISYTSSLNTLSGNWTGFTDFTSGIVDYQYAIGTTVNGTEVKNWTSNGIDTSFSYLDYTLTNSAAYFISVKAIDMVGNVSDTVSSNGVVVDHEIPLVGLVVDGIDGDKAFTNTDTIYASWSGFADSLSGISHYEYAVGTIQGGTDIISWTDNAIENSIVLANILKDASSYYVSVRAVDNVGNTSEVAISNGIIADFMPPSVINVSIQNGSLLPILNDAIIYFTLSEVITYGTAKVESKTGDTIKDSLSLNINSGEDQISPIVIKISNPFTSADTIEIKIDGLTDKAGNVTNGLVYKYNVSLLGDYDLDGDIGVTDLSTFVNSWKSEDTSLEIGPTVGVIPNLKPIPDNKYNSRDMMAFTRMWHWNTNKLGKQQTKIIADQGADLNAVIEADHIVFDPPRGTQAIELILDYPASNIQFNIATHSGFSDEGLALSSVDTVNGRFVYQIGYFEANHKPIRIDTKHLQKNDIAVNLTYQFIGTDNVILSAGSETMDITPVPSEFALHDNYPNPFNPVTTINYDLPKDAYVNLIIYDIMGREVVNLAGQEMSAGYQTMSWNARNNAGALVSAGIYFYQIQTRDFIKTKKMVLLK